MTLQICSRRENKCGRSMPYLKARNAFLGIAGSVALLVGLMATLLPETFLVLKGVVPIEATVLWMRETGLLLLALGGFAFLARSLAPSLFTFGYLVVNVLVQLGLLTFEILAYNSGILTGWASVVPSSLLNAILGAGFFWCAVRQLRSE